MEVLIRGDN